MKLLVEIAGALADESRVRVVLGLALLRERGVEEICVCQVTEFLGLATSTVSKHLSVLKQAGLVESRKEGRWMYYRLPGGGSRDASELVRQAIAWVRAHGLDKVGEERKKWESILKEDPEDLCRRQMCGSENSKCCSSAPATRAGARWRKGGRAPSRGT